MNTLAIGLVGGLITGLRLILHVVVHWVTVVCEFVGGSVVVSSATAVVVHNNAVTKMINNFILMLPYFSPNTFKFFVPHLIKHDN